MPQDANQLLDVVTIERTEVTDVHSFKNILLVRDGRLDCIGQSDKSPASVIFHQAYLVKPAGKPEAQGVVCLIGIQREQVFLHTSHGTVNGHVVVVKYDEDVVVRRRYVVESLVSKAA